MLEDLFRWRNQTWTLLFYAYALYCSFFPKSIIWAVLLAASLLATTCWGVGRKEAMRNIGRLQIRIRQYCLWYEHIQRWQRRGQSSREVLLLVTAVLVILLLDFKWIVASIIMTIAFISHPDLIALLTSQRIIKSASLMSRVKQGKDDCDHDEVVECERWWLGIGWTKSTPSSDPPSWRHLSTGETCTEVDRTRWQLHVDKTTDVDGWVYTNNQWINPRPCADSWSYTRLRLWTRIQS